MPRVLVAGYGYLGRATADLFRDAGWAVEAWKKAAGPGHPSENYPIAAVDISDRHQVERREGEFEIVIHCASTRGGEVEAYRGVYLNGASNLLARFPGSTLLLVGSTSVYAQRNGEWVTEESEAEPPHERGKILRETERLVLTRGGVVARLAGIYGPGRSYLLERFLSSEAVLDAANDRFVNQIHRDDAAGALFLLAAGGSALGPRIFNVTDDQPLLQSECYRWLAERLSRPIPPTGKSASSEKRGRSNKRVRNAKLRALGWSPKFPTFADAMEKSVLPSFTRALSGSV